MVACASVYLQQGTCRIEPSQFDLTEYIQLPYRPTLHGWTTFDPADPAHLQMFQAQTYSGSLQVAIPLNHVETCFPGSDIQWVENSLYLSRTPTMHLLTLAYTTVDSVTHFVLVTWSKMGQSHHQQNKHCIPSSITLYPWETTVHFCSSETASVQRPTYTLTVANIRPQEDSVDTSECLCTVVYQHQQNVYVTIHHNSTARTQLGQQSTRWMRWYRDVAHDPARHALYRDGQLNLSTAACVFNPIENASDLDTLWMYAVLYQSLPPHIQVDRLHADPDLFLHRCHGNVPTDADVHGPCITRLPTPSIQSVRLGLQMEQYTVRDAYIQAMEHLLLLAVHHSGQWYLLRAPLDMVRQVVQVQHCQATRLCARATFAFERPSRPGLSSSVIIRCSDTRRLCVQLDGTLVAIQSERSDLSNGTVVGGTHIDLETGDWKTSSGRTLYSPVHQRGLPPYIQQNHVCVWATYQDQTVFFRHGTETLDPYIAFQHHHGYVARVLGYHSLDDTWWIYYRSAIYVLHTTNTSTDVSVAAPLVNLYRSNVWRTWKNTSQWPLWSTLIILSLCIACIVIFKSCKCR